MSSNNHEIIYPVFLNCCKYSENIFWKSLFEDLAYGISPPNTYFLRNHLCCSQKNKSFSFKFSNINDHAKLYYDLSHILKNRLGILSFTEKNKNRINFLNTSNLLRSSYNNWKDIKKKSIKDLLIEDFVASKTLLFNLTPHQSKILITTIHVSLIFKIIISTDITFDSNSFKILKIKGLSFDTKFVNSFHFNQNPYFIDSHISSSENNIKQPISNQWLKYLDIIKKIKTTF